MEQEKSYHSQASDDSEYSFSPDEDLEPRRSTDTIETPIELQDKYCFIRDIGHGNQGHVFKARRLSDNKIVAIKLLHIDSIQNWKEYELFKREADTLASLNVKGVAQFYESIECLEAKEPFACIVQEYIEGRSLDAIMRSGYRFSVQRIFKLAVELIELLEKLHTHAPTVIHRDIKPSNILLKQTDKNNFEPWLIDFGAVANPQVQAGGSTVAGTYGYMPPEQLTGTPCPQSDIYALGAMLAYMLSGVKPEDMKTSDFRLIIEPHLEAFPLPVITVLRQMLDPNVQTRLHDYSKLKKQFQSFSEDIFSDSNQTAVTPTDYDNHLLKVKKYLQPGNLDLWLQLPDITPRCVPEIYKNIEHTDILSRQSLFSLKKYTYLSSSGGNDFSIIRGFLIFALICIATTVFISINMARWEPILVGFGLIVFLFAILILPAFFGTLLDIKKRDQRFQFTPDEFPKDLDLLIQKGKKSIATIVDVTYIPTDRNKLEPFYLMGITSQNESMFRDQLINDQPSEDMAAYCHDLPSFKIRYKFNPPDDDNPNDLIHEVITHCDYADSISRGDPLPILYYVNSNDNFDVMSVPFPIPVDDFVHYKDLYYANKKDEKGNQ